MQGAWVSGCGCSPQSGLGVGCKLCSSSKKLRGLSARAHARRMSIYLSFSVAGVFSFLSSPRSAMRCGAWKCKTGSRQNSIRRNPRGNLGGLNYERPYLDRTAVTRAGKWLKIRYGLICSITSLLSGNNNRCLEKKLKNSPFLLFFSSTALDLTLQL